MRAAGGGAEGGGDGMVGAGLLGCWVVSGRWMAWGEEEVGGGEIISAGQRVGRGVGRIIRVEGWGIDCLGIYSLDFEERVGVGGREAFGKEG